MKQLILVRHAKSSWKNSFAIKDINRGLNGRGKKDAPKMGAELFKRGIVPDTIVTSSAKRAFLTAKAFAEELGIDPSAVGLESDLYFCKVNDFVEVANSQDNSINKLMIIAHNPSLNEFANRAIPNFLENIPTSGVLVFDADIDKWADLDLDKLALKLKLYPKML